MKRNFAIFVVLLFIAAAAAIYFKWTEIQTYVEANEQNFIIIASTIVALFTFLTVLVVYCLGTNKKPERIIRFSLLLIVALVTIFLKNISLSLGLLLHNYTSFVNSLIESCYSSTSWYCVYETTSVQNIIPLISGFAFSVLFAYVVFKTRNWLFKGSDMAIRFDVMCYGLLFFAALEVTYTDFGSLPALIFVNGICYTSAVLIIFTRDTKIGELLKTDADLEEIKKPKGKDEKDYPWSVG